MSSLSARFKERLVNQITCVSEQVNAAHTAFADLRFMIHCFLNVQNSGAQFFLTKTPVVYRSTSSNHVQSASAEASSGEEKILLFG